MGKSMNDFKPTNHKSILKDYVLLKIFIISLFALSFVILLFDFEFRSIIINKLRIVYNVDLMFIILSTITISSVIHLIYSLVFYKFNIKTLHNENKLIYFNLFSLFLIPLLLSNINNYFTVYFNAVMLLTILLLLTYVIQPLYNRLLSITDKSEYDDRLFRLVNTYPYISYFILIIILPFFTELILRYLTLILSIEAYGVVFAFILNPFLYSLIRIKSNHDFKYFILFFISGIVFTLFYYFGASIYSLFIASSLFYTILYIKNRIELNS